MDKEVCEVFVELVEVDPNEKIKSLYAKELKTICSRLSENGEESVILTVNMAEKSCKYITSQIGGKFLSGRIELLEQFFKLCYDHYSSSATSPPVKNSQGEHDKEKETAKEDIHTDDLVTSRFFVFDIQDIHDNVKDSTGQEQFANEIKIENSSRNSESKHDDLKNGDKSSLVDLRHVDKQNEVSMATEASDNSLLDENFTCNQEESSDVTFDQPKSKLPEKESDDRDNAESNRRSSRPRLRKAPSWIKSYVLNKEDITKGHSNRSGKKDGNKKRPKSETDHDYVPSRGLRSESRSVTKRLKSDALKAESESEKKQHTLSKTKNLPDFEGVEGEFDKHKISFTCPSCGKIFSQCRYLSVHMSTVHLDKRSICKICGKMFDSKEDLINHKANHKHSKQDHDYVPFGRLRSENRNVKSVSIPDTSHRQKIESTSPKHNASKTAFHCSACDKAFSQPRYLSLHMATVHREKYSICKDCGKSFDSKEDLLKHKAQHTKRSDEKMSDTNVEQEGERSLKPNFTCPTCGKTFFQCRYLSVHMATVHLDKCSICRECGKIFDSKDNLIKHKIKHTQSNDDKMTENEIEEGEMYTKERSEIIAKVNENKQDSMKSGEGNKLQNYADESNGFDAIKTEGCIEECGSTFSEDVEHINSEQILEKELFKCAICDAKFRKKKSLQHHLQTHQVSKADCLNEQTNLENHDESSEKDDECGKMDDNNHLSHSDDNHSENERTAVDKSEIKDSVKENDLVKDKTSGKYPCNDCGRLFSTKLGARVHKEIHSNNPPYKCEHCGKTFKLSRYLHLHLKGIHKDGKCICKYCRKTFASSFELRKHYKMNHPSNFKQIQSQKSLNKWYHCSVCRKVCATELLLKKHMQMHVSGSDLTYKCHHCGKIFFKTTYLAEHLTRIHKEKRSICRICSQQFSSKVLLMNHMEVHNLKNPNTCKSCGKTFDDIKQLVEHKKTHSEKLTLICEFCGKTFNRNFELNIHRRFHSGDKPYKCTICGARFAASYILKAHQNVHENSRQFQCEECGLSLKSYSSLLKHIKTHKNVTVKCSYCERKFKSQEGYHHHLLREHLDSIDWSKVNFKYRQCEYCSLFFAQKHTFDRHVATHTGDFKVACEICGKLFPNTATLTRHKYNHNPVKRFMCNICNSGSNCRSKIQKHLRSHKHRANCDKLGLTLEESKSKISVYQATEEEGKQEEIIPNTDSSQDKGAEISYQVSEELPFDISNIDTRTTECVIISLPDIDNMAVGENQIAYDLGDGTVIQSIIKLE